MNRPLLARDYAYRLPADRIAQYPRPRGKSRLLILPKRRGQPVHGHIRDLDRWLRPGDCLVVNDTKVLPARLYAVKIETGAKIELLLLRPSGRGQWEALARPARKLQVGTRLQIGSAILTVSGRMEHGKVSVHFPRAHPAQAIMQAHGHVPLPPYIRRADRRRDRERYQTLFARAAGSAAAPTAGLHFDEDLKKRLESHGVRIATVTLHIGQGTFSPLPESDLTGHWLHEEPYHIPRQTCRIIHETRKRGGRVICCGTTAARALESAAAGGALRAGPGKTRLFIHPGFTWRIVDGLLTNFHLPRSSLLILVSALTGRTRVLRAYRAALRAGYKFFSYGDAMLLI